MGLPSLPGLPLLACDPSLGFGCAPPFSFPGAVAQEPPPPYTPVQHTVTTVNQPNQLNTMNEPFASGGAVNWAPVQGQPFPFTGNTPVRDNRMLTNAYNPVNFGPVIPNHFCNCAECKGIGQ